MSNLIQKILEPGTFDWHLEPHTHHTLIQVHEENSAEQITSHTFKLAPGSSLIYCPIILGKAPVQLAISATLAQGAQLKVAGAYALSGQQECSIITRQEHEGTGSHSSLLMNGVVADQAFMQYAGTIAIQKAAAYSVASQENKTLLLGDTAKAISIPSLEVLNNQVQCAHGSAVGPLRQDQLQYVQARGLSKDAARRLLITSFFARTLQGIGDQDWRQKIVMQLVAKLELSSI
jgi:Fe-S cluster assembly protein SufD